MLSSVSPLSRLESGSVERRDSAGAVQPGCPVGATGTEDRTVGGLRWARGTGASGRTEGKEGSGKDGARLAVAAAPGGSVTGSLWAELQAPEGFIA